MKVTLDKLLSLQATIITNSYSALLDVYNPNPFRFESKSLPSNRGKRLKNLFQAAKKRFEARTVNLDTNSKYDITINEQGK